MIWDLLLVAIVFGLHGYWIYALCTYDWTKHEQDKDTYGNDMW